MRVFVGIPLPLTAKKAIYDPLHPLRDKFNRVRWVAYENYHVTVAFIGEVETDAVDQISELLESVSHAPFKASGNRLGQFPRTGPPRVIHVPVEEGSAECCAIYESVVETVRPFLIRRPEKKYEPHITIARVKGKPNGGLVKEIELSEVCTEFTIDKFTLYLSELTPRGSKYTVLRNFPLRES